MESRAPSPDTAAFIETALGKYGITRQQIEVMSRSELDGYIQALARLHGKNPPAGDQTTRRVKSMRQKRPRKPNKKGRI